MTQDDLLPLLPDRIGDVEFPVHGREEGHLVGVDFAHLQAGNFTPRTSGVVAVLQVFGGKDESSQEHAATTLEGSNGRNILRLFHSEIMLRHMCLDEYQIVQRNLKRRVARARSAQSLLYEGAEGKNTTTR